MKKALKMIVSLVLVLQMMVVPFGTLAGALEAADAVGTIIDVTDFGADPSGKGDSTIPIQEALEAAKEVDGPVTLSFPKGEYHVYKDFASKRVYHTSNTGSLSYPEKSIGILIEDQENLTIDGNGSLFMMHGDIMAIAVVRSKNVTLQNFVLDYEVPNTMDTTIVGTGTTEDGKPYMDMYIPANYHYSISDDEKHIDWTSELSPYTGKPYWTEKDRLGPYLVIYKGYDETVRRHTAQTEYDSANVLDADPFVDVQHIRPQSDNIVRFTYNSRRPEAQELGNVYLFSNSVTRKTAGAFIWESDTTTVRDIDVHYLAGFGWLTQMSKDTEFNGINFLPRQGTGKYTTSNADQIHVAGAAGYFNVINCNFSMAHDDPINIHGSYLRVEEVIDSKTLRLAYIHGQQGGFTAYHPGDQVMFYSRTHLESVAHVDENDTFTVASTVNPGEAYNGSNLSMKETIVTFEEDLSQEVLDALKVKIKRKASDPEEPLYVAENVTYAPTVHIKGNVMRSIPTRGILCTTRNPVIVEDNIFENLAMAGMYLSNDADYWYESGPIRDMTIRNNKFYVRTTGQKEWDAAGPIYVDPVIIRSYIVSSGVEPTPKGDPVHRNINVVDNEIHMGDYQIIVAEGVMGMRFEGNTVVRDNPNVNIQLMANKTDLGIGEAAVITPVVTEQTLPKDAFVFKNCSDVVINNNTYDDGFKMNVKVTKNNAVVPPSQLDGMVSVGSDPLQINGTKVDIASSQDKIQYASSNPAVVQVDYTGNVRALSKGEADVYAFYELNGTIVKSELVHYTVTGDGELWDSLTINEADIQLIEEAGDTLTFTSNPAGVNWSVVDARTGAATTAATIDENGVLTGLEDGVVKVIASKNGLSDSRTVIISTPVSYGAEAAAAKVKMAARAMMAGGEKPLAAGFSIKPGTEVPANISSTKDTEMTLTSDANGQISGSGNGATQNMVLYEIPADIAKDNFRAQVTIDGLPQTPWGGAAMMLYTDDDNYVSIGQKGHLGVVSVNEKGGDFVEKSGAVSAKVEKGTFEIEKNGSMVFLKYNDNGTWRVVFGYSIGEVGLDDSNLKIAFYVNQQGGGAVKATFSDFRIADASVNSDALSAQEPVKFFGAEAGPAFATGFSVKEGTEVPANLSKVSDTAVKLVADQNGTIREAGEGATQNLVLYEIPKDIAANDFRVQVTIDGLPLRDDSSAALLVYTDDDNYVGVGQKGSVGVASFSESKGSYAEREDTTGSKVMKGQFEIEKTSSNIYVKFWDGRRWKIINGISPSSSGLEDSNLKIAFYVSKMGEDAVEATFSDFRIATATAVDSDALSAQEPVVIFGKAASGPRLTDGFSFAEGTEVPANWSSEKTTEINLVSNENGQISGKDQGTPQNLVLYDIPTDIAKDNMRLQVTIDGLPQTPYGGAAVMLFTDTDNYVSIGQKGHIGVVTVNEVNGTYSERPDNLGAKLTKGQFEIEKTSSTIYVKFWDGRRWKVISAYSPDITGLDDSNLKVAFYVNQQGADAVNATFSDFRIANASVNSDDLSQQEPVAITTTEGGEEPDPGPEPKPSVLEEGVNIWQNTEKWFATGKRDELSVHAEVGDLYNNQTTAKNTVTVDVPAEWADDLRVQGTIALDNLSNLANYANASMALFTDGDNYISVGQKAHMAGAATANEKGAVTAESSYPAISKSRVMTYEMEKRGNDIYLRCKPEGGEWKDINPRSMPLVNDALGSSFKLAFLTWNKGVAYPLTCTYSGVKMAKASESTTESLEQQTSKSLVKAYPNMAPTVSDIRMNQDSYVVGNYVSVVSYNYADAENHAQGAPLYKWQYVKDGKNVTEYTNYSEIKAENAGDVTCTVFVFDAYGKPCKAPASKTVHVQTVDSYALKELLINGNLPVGFQGSKYDYIYAIPDTMEFFTVDYKAINPLMGTTEIQDLDGNVITDQVLRVADYKGIKIVRLNNGAAEMTYTVTFRPVASNNTKSVISVDGNALTEEIKSGTHSYFTALTNEQNVVEFAVDIPDDATDVKVYRSFYRDKIVNEATEGNDFSAMVDLYSGLNIFNIDVTAADGLTVTRYRAQVFRAGYNDAYATDIQFNGVTVQGFDPEVTDYKLPITSEEMRNLTVDVAPVEGKDTTASVTINNSRTEGTKAEGKLDQNTNTVVVAVKAENKFTAKYYSFTMYTPDETNASLDVLSVPGETINELFDENRTEYTMSASGKPITLQARTWEEGATIEVTAENGQSFTATGSLNQEVLVYKGDNLITVKVTAPDGKTEKIYTIEANVWDEVNLSELDWTSGSYTGYGSTDSERATIQKNLSNDGNPLTMNLNGKETVFETGVGAMTSAYIYYNIENRGFTKMVGYVGVDKESAPGTRAGFEIYYNLNTKTPAGLGTGVRVHGGDAGRFEINIPEGTNTLGLWAYGSDSTNVHVDWADVKFINPDAVENPNPGPAKTYEVAVSYGKKVNLLVDNEKQPPVGFFKDRFEQGTEITLNFAPYAEGREIGGVKLNGETMAFTDSASYEYTYTVGKKDAALDFTFEIINKATLRTMIEYAEKCEEDGVVGESVPAVQKAFGKALAAAKKADEALEITQNEIDQSWKDLLKVIQMLEFKPGDKDALLELIEQVEAFDLESYTSASVAKLNEMLEIAKAVYDDENSMQDEIDEARENLYKAFIDLKDLPNTSELEEVIAKAESLNLNDYVDVGQDVFTEKLEEAKTVLENSEDQKEVTAAANALAEAMADLRLKADKSKLEELTKEANELNLNGYTASSVKKFETVRDKMNALMAKPNSEVSQDEVDALIEKYYEAKKNLSTGGSTTKPSGSSKPSAPSNNNAYGASGTAVVGAAQNVLTASVRSDTTVDFTLKRGSAYCFKMTVLNGDNLTPSFTVGNGDVLKTQFVARIGNDYYYRVWAVGAPGSSTGVYTTLPGQNAVKHCTVKIG